MTDGAATPAADATRRRRWLVPAVLAASVAVLSVGTWAAAAVLAPVPVSQPITAPETRDSVATASPPEATAEPTGEPEPSPTAEPEPVGARPLPTSCDGLFSDSITATLTGEYQVTLNPYWTMHTDAIPLPTTDASLSAVLADQPRLDCNWMPDGGGHTGIITVIASVDEGEAADVERRLAELYSRADESFGTRYFYEDWDTPAGSAVGESHLVRDGLWIATRWGNIPITGYTADIAGHLFG